MGFLRKHWKKGLWTIAIIIFPFVLEWFLFITPVVSRFTNEAWFAFIGSYAGAIVTLIVMVVTFTKSEQDNKKIIRQQKKQHEIELQNKMIAQIIHVLLIDGYYFFNPDTVGENMDKFIGDLHYVQFDTLKLKYITHADENLLGELLKLQIEEVKIINDMQEVMPHVDSEQKAKEMKELLLRKGLELRKTANLQRERIKILYDSYLEKVYEHYYD